jgi:hypothetical protein
MEYNKFIEKAKAKHGDKDDNINLLIIKIL